ncbi:MAG: JAB domain-containing protein [Cyclobacteriaceae bacterium]
MTQQFKSLVGEIKVSYEPGIRFKSCISKSQDAYEELRPLFNQISYKEQAFMLLLNRANNTLGWVKLSEGGINGTVMDIRIIVQHALLSHATSIILAHNHPSGNRQPSQQDLTITSQIKKGCRLLEINLLDHLIITSDGYTSLADEGRI